MPEWTYYAKLTRPDWRSGPNARFGRGDEALVPPPDAPIRVRINGREYWLDREERRRPALARFLAWAWARLRK